MLQTVHGLSHGDAAKALGVSKDTVKVWRRRNPDVEAIAPAADEVPLCTVKLSQVFAQLLNAGCPQLQAIGYMFPHLTKTVMTETTRRWVSDPLVTIAVEELQGGAFISLPPERRYELALQKHLSELAFFLHANNYNDAVNKDVLEMFKQAREVLKAELKGGTDESDPMQAFARFALEMAKAHVLDKAAASPTAPALQPSTADRIHEEMTAIKLPQPGQKLM